MDFAKKSHPFEQVLSTEDYLTIYYQKNEELNNNEKKHILIENIFYIISRSIWSISR